ncbi:E3 SUMO-protein ligase ZBED1-like [Apostichopus japonicus]|uniref:E3 SUMO-protein ligase ZBED1-like n=1 Tax=Stichopus japonicus TaxID=307972 RepID=UPI003AB4665F
MPSKVWNSFEKSVQSSVKCKICGTLLKYLGGSTGSMTKHLKLRHQVAEKALSATMDAFISRTVCNPKKAERLNNLLVEMVAKDALPVSFIEGDGFRALMKAIEPSYVVPSRKTMSALLKAKYEEKKTTLQTDLEKIAFMSVTTDCWTSRSSEGYMTVTAHGLDGDWVNRSYVLDTTPVVNQEGGQDTVVRHTADALTTQMSRIVKEWGLENKLDAIVHDNASNVKHLGESLGVDDVACAGHTLQLCVNNGLKAHPQIGRLIACGKKLVAHFRKSVTATKALEVKQEQLGLPKHKLIQSVCTRWNSVFEMLKRLVEQRWAVCAVLSDRHFTSLTDVRTLEIRDEDWRIAEELLACLEPLQVIFLALIVFPFFILQIATTVLSSEQNTSLSSVLPIVSGLVKRHLKVDAEDIPAVKAFKITTSNDLKRRFTPSEEVSRAQLASFLDPRYKGLKFLSKEEQVMVQDKMKEHISEQQPATKKRRRSSNVAEPQRSAMDFLLGDGDDNQTPQCDDFDERELAHYIGLPTPSHNSNPNLWWKQYHTNFPILSTLAQRYLGTPSTSVPSERIFSTAGNIVNSKRSCFLPANVNILVFWNKNL